MTEKFACHFCDKENDVFGSLISRCDQCDVSFSLDQISNDSPWFIRSIDYTILTSDYSSLQINLDINSVVIWKRLTTPEKLKRIEIPYVCGILLPSKVARFAKQIDNLRAFL
jgi:hypothetical protein